MSLTLNMVGGGGGGLKATDALLRVQAPAGSTVTITKGTTTKTDLGHENADDHSVYDYYFIIHQSQFDSVNPWTVTATLNGDTASDTIIINAADEYNLILKYRYYIIKNGVVGSGFTCARCNGGASNGGSATPTAEDGYMELALPSNSGRGMYVGPFDLTDYTTFVYEIEFISGHNYSWCRQGVANDINWYNKNISTSMICDSGETSVSLSKEVRTFDISNLTNTNVYFKADVWTEPAGSIRFYNIYMTNEVVP